MSRKRKSTVFEDLLDKVTDPNFDAKRPRLRTPSPGAPRAELTTRNLRLHTELESPEESLTMAGDSTATIAATDCDSPNALRRYGIVLDSSAQQPLRASSPSRQRRRGAAGC